MLCHENPLYSTKHQCAKEWQEVLFTGVGKLLELLLPDLIHPGKKRIMCTRVNAHNGPKR
jgi:hypothetical protein